MAAWAQPELSTSVHRLNWTVAQAKNHAIACTAHGPAATAQQQHTNLVLPHLGHDVLPNLVLSLALHPLQISVVLLLHLLHSV